jgi:secreted trypsin-like serine protease
LYICASYHYFHQAEPGGPVIYKNALGTWTAIGIVSYDFNPFIQGTAESFLDYCRTGPSIPRAFTRISSYFDWICSMTNDCSLTTEFTPLSTGQTYPSATDPSTDSSNFTSADSITSTHTQSRSSSATPNPDQRLNSADPKPVTVPFGLCGRANGQGANPIYREIQTMTSHEFPWLAFFYFGNSFEDKVWCTGSIIGPKWIMTAASCVDQNRYLYKFLLFVK